MAVRVDRAGKVGTKAALCHSGPTSSGEEFQPEGGHWLYHRSEFSADLPLDFGVQTTLETHSNLTSWTLTPSASVLEARAQEV